MPFNPASSLAALLAAPVRPGRIAWIGIRPARREPMVTLEAAELDPDRGLAGDRYTKRGARQVTLIQAEGLAAIASHLGLGEVRPEDIRRNIVTTGINLLALKRRRLRLGEAVIELTGECHPCSRMEEVFGTGGYNAVRGFGGVTARVVAPGTLRVGDDVAPEPLQAA